MLIKNFTILITILYLYGTTFAQEVSDIKSYKHAIGGRLGLLGQTVVYSDIDFMAISYKRFFKKRSAYEINLGFGAAPVGWSNTLYMPSLSAAYQWHVPFGHSGVRFFLGAGAVVLYKIPKTSGPPAEKTGFDLGAFPVIGFDYKAKRNFNMAVDFRPGGFIEKDPNIYAGLNFRRTF